MSCYFRHIKDLFEQAGVRVTKENKKAIDAAIHKAVGVEYKDCPAAWRAVKRILVGPGGKEKLILTIKNA